MHCLIFHSQITGVFVENWGKQLEVHMMYFFGLVCSKPDLWFLEPIYKD